MSSSLSNAEPEDRTRQGPEKNVDEQVEGASVAVEASAKMELADPAILEVRGAVEQPRLTYTREELLKLRDSPFSLVQPAQVNTSCWSSVKKRPETPAGGGGRPNPDQQDGHGKAGGPRKAAAQAVTTIQRRAGGGDPKERLRKEQDRIVLSPQRESFNHGCFVPAGREPARPPNNRSHSPLGGGKSGGDVGPGAAPSRRIGSGRIIRDAWDYPDKGEEFGGRFERRSFGRDFETAGEKERDRHIGRGNGRYNDRRRISAESREEEPEWFSGGPLSQTDTIELRGFEDSDRTAGGKKKQSPAQKKRSAERAKAKTVEAQQPALKKTEEDGEGEKREERASPVAAGEQEAKDVGGGGDDGRAEGEAAKENSLDFFFNETISGLLTNGVGGDGDATSASSRFTQFFKREKTPPAGQGTAESRRSSLQDNTIIRNVLKDIEEPNVSIPPAGDSSSYFAPISPAANTSRPISDLVEMLQRYRGAENVGMAKGGLGKLLHLEEIEANMRQGGEPANASGQKVAQQKSEEDVTAFRRLLAQMQGSNSSSGVPQKSQPMTLMEMLSHSQQQDEVRMAAAVSAALRSPGMHPAAAAAHHHQQQQQQQHELAMKLQHLQSQVQQRNAEMLSKMMGAARQQMRTSPLPAATDLGAQQARELLGRPEAQAILQGLQRGDITPQHLHQQLAANPAMQPRHRELLYTILKLQQQQQGRQQAAGGSRVLSPVPPPHAATASALYQQQQQQQLRVSPLPPNAYCVSPILATSPNTLTVPAMHQRIPSPRELQVHTQNILQRALIKKKLEEQQENYRKKQEMQLQQRGQSPGVGAVNNNNNNNSVAATKSVSSPTPLAFTPTSVLRKMTADRDDGSKEGGKGGGEPKAAQQQGRAVTGIRPQVQQQQQQQQPQMQQWGGSYNVKQTGRPILKSNTSYQQTASSVGQPQQDQQFYQQQQRLFNQQQRQKQQQQFGNPPPPPSSGQYSSPPQYNPPNQYNQLTQQQLRAQHQQHVRSQQQPTQQQQQQQRWLQMLNQQQQNYDERTSHHGRPSTGESGGGELSPTSNQLARWFSPTLLEKARAGKLPNMPSAGLAQHAVSLEEIERQTAAPVHN